MVKEKTILSYFLGWLILGFIVCFVGITNVNALEYILPSKFAGKVPNDIFWLEPKATLFGEFYYETPVASMDDYLLVTFCASGPIGAWTGAVNVQADGFKVDTDLWCSAGSYEGTMQQIYYPVNTWTYKEDNLFAYMQDTATFRNPNDYNVQVRLLNITSSSSLDMSMSILAYLKSKETNQDYSTVLQEIQKNQEAYKEEINEVQDKIDETNNQLGELNDTLTDSSGPDTSSLENSAGWLPAGPLDSILNLPLTMLNSLTNSLNKSCSPLNISLPFVNKQLQIPCLSAIFAKITGVTSLWSWVGTIASVLILYNYLLNLYAWVDKVLTLRAEFDEAMGADLANWGRL